MPEQTGKRMVSLKSGKCRTTLICALTDIYKT